MNQRISWVFCFLFAQGFLITFFPVDAVCEDDEGGEDQPVLRMGDRDPELLLRVNAAIFKGTEWLEKQQRADGSWSYAWAAAKPPGDMPSAETALALLTLRKVGESSLSECFPKGFDWLRKQPLRKTQEAGLWLSALKALYYQSSPPPFPAPKQTTVVPQRDRDWMREGVQFMLDHRVASGQIRGENPEASAAILDVWNDPPGNGDHENTLFALIGLRGASQCGIQIPEDLWILTIRHFVEVQEKDGPEVQRYFLVEENERGIPLFKPRAGSKDKARGWCRNAREVAKAESTNADAIATGDMTCAGLASIAIALDQLGPKCHPELKMAGERAIWDGIAWLVRNWKVDANPRQTERGDHFFFLFCLAKAAELTWTRAFGEHDWYREGAEWLLAHQNENGSWDDSASSAPISNTCFALLFLAKSTVTIR